MVNDVTLGVGQVTELVYFDPVIVLEATFSSLPQLRLPTWPQFKHACNQSDVELWKWENLGELSIFQMLFLK